MDALGDLLAPYSQMLGKIAGMVASAQMLSLFILMNDIRKKKSSDTFSANPFLIGIVLSVLSLKLGSIMEDANMINVNLFGFAVNVIGTMVFYFYASNAKKSSVWAKIGLTGAFVAVCLAYASIEDPKLVEMRVGLIITGLLVILVGSPLLGLKQIIAKKSVEGLPFPLILSGTATCLAWTLYGISLKNPVFVYQNLFLLVLSGIQLALFAIYPSTPQKTTPKKSKSKKLQ